MANQPAAPLPALDPDNDPADEQILLEYITGLVETDVLVSDVTQVSCVSRLKMEEECGLYPWFA